MPAPHYPKGSPEAKAYMAQLRAIRDAKRAANPLSPSETREILLERNRSHSIADGVSKMPSEQARAAFNYGKAAGLSRALHEAGASVPDRQNGFSDEQLFRRMGGRAVGRDKDFHHEIVQEARAREHKARGSNPLTVEEAAELRKILKAREAAGIIAASDDGWTEESGDPLPGEAARYFGEADMARLVLEKFAPRGTNPHPMLVLGNPGTAKREVKLKRNADGSFEQLVTHLAKNPSAAAFEAVSKHPRCVGELRAYHKRHGGGPVAVKIVMVPDGYPWVASSWGKSPNVVYDAPRHSNKGKRIHHFGEGGGKKPDLISSTEKGPKFLAFADGTFRADGEWILK